MLFIFDADSSVSQDKIGYVSNTATNTQHEYNERVCLII